MNLLFIWTGVTAYMGDCWRALATQPGIRLKIVIQEKRHPGTQFAHEHVLHSLDATIIYDDEPLDREELRKELAAFSPDVIFVVGWRAKLSRFTATEPCFSRIPKVLIFDLPFAWTFKKLVAPIVLRSYLKRFHVCFVPGVRARAYAKWLGFKQQQIEEGLFSVGAPTSKGAYEGRKHFLYVGRYVKEKRLDLLVKAYGRYRQRVQENPEMGFPWSLTCCGMGPEERFVQQVEGVQDLGFCQPHEVEKLRFTHGALVLASAFDPWPLVIAEACASGLPVICTEACGNHVELVQGNGIVCKSGDVESLAQAMLAFHALPEQERVIMGQKGLELVKPYLSDAWVARVIALSQKVMESQ